MNETSSNIMESKQVAANHGLPQHGQPLHCTPAHSKHGASLGYSDCSIIIHNKLHHIVQLSHHQPLWVLKTQCTLIRGMAFTTQPPTTPTHTHLAPHQWWRCIGRHHLHVCPVHIQQAHGSHISCIPLQHPCRISLPQRMQWLHVTTSNLPSCQGVILCTLAFAQRAQRAYHACWAGGALGQHGTTLGTTGSRCGGRHRCCECLLSWVVQLKHLVCVLQEYEAKWCWMVLQVVYKCCYTQGLQHPPCVARGMQ